MEFDFRQRNETSILQINNLKSEIENLEHNLSDK